MLVLSGALVLCAVLLLIAGLAAHGLTIIYASIAVSGCAAGMLLAAGRRRRRGSAADRPADASAADLPQTAAPPAAGNDDEDEGPEAASQRARPGQSEPAAAAAGPDPGMAGGTPTEAIVFVVGDRPLYHLEGCPRLDMSAAEPIEVEEAREIGFTRCPTCRPEA